jgi:hypothetical protein
MGLYQDSGGTNDDRVLEARKLLDIIAGGDQDQLSPWEIGFVESISDQVNGFEPRITAKQVFKLKDVKDKVIR